MKDRTKTRDVRAALVAWAAAALTVAGAMAAAPEGVITIRSKSKGRVTVVSGSNRAAMEVEQSGLGSPTALDAIGQYGGAFGVTNALLQLAPRRQWTDRLGHRHTSLRQIHKGVPVFGGELKVHQDQAGRLLGANGDFYAIDGAIRTDPTLTVERAIAVARRDLDYKDPVVWKKELVIVDPGWYGDPPIGAHLSYYITLHDNASGEATAFLVEAHSGRELDRWSLQHTARVRRIYDGGQEDVLPGTLVRGEGEPPVVDPEDADRAYDFAGDLYGFLSRALNRDGVDGAGLPLTITVNSTASGCPNAFWEDRLLQSAFCEGTVSDDIVGHELGHALTLFTAGLLIQNQPGQLNESFADVLGELVDLYNGDSSRVGAPGGTPWPAHPTGGGLDTPNLRRTSCTGAPDFADGVRWLVGEDAVAFGDALRDMWDPTCHRHPDRTGSEFYTCPPLDNGGVHIGSSVVNHAFAMLVDGKEFNGYTVHAIGPEKAAAVWFRALEVYLTVASNFEDAYHAFGQSASDMIGAMPYDPRTGQPTGEVFTTFDAQQVENALLATEMDRGELCGIQEPVLDPAPAPRCGTETIVFQEDFEAGSIGWTLENSGPPTPYDWEVTDDALPSQRPGRALFCADRHVGDCATVDESAVHSAISPAIRMPLTVARAMLSFEHLIASDTGWDGGNINVSVNGGAWQAVPTSAFLFNPYNARIRSAFFENNNPLAGQLGWSGAGGGWGTTLIDLGALVTGGDMLQIRFDFGKDLCVGSDGWYVDDVTVFACGDCNLNGIPDSADFHFTAVASTETTLGYGNPVAMTVSPIPRAASDVTLTTYAAADLNGFRETLTVFLNGVEVGSLYGRHGDAQDCPSIADRAGLVIARDAFNAILDGETLVIEVVASQDVSPLLCADGTLLAMLIDFIPETKDDNDNQIPDECEGCTIPDALTPEADGVNKNRFVSFVPPRTQRLTAIRARLTEAPTPYATHIGENLWVAEPFSSGIVDGEAVGYSRLACDPVFSDWSAYDLVHAGDALVVPGVAFDLQAIDLACFGALPIPPVDADIDDYTAPLSLPTVRHWGDLVGATVAEPPGDGPFVIDLVVMVDTLQLQGTIIGRARADLLPQVPDLRTTVFEVVALVDAIQGTPYPYPSPARCE